MIIYELVCRSCGNTMERDIDEMTFLRNLMNEERVICSFCGNSFVNEDSDYHGKMEQA